MLKTLYFIISILLILSFNAYCEDNMPDADTENKILDLMEKSEHAKSAIDRENAKKELISIGAPAAVVIFNKIDSLRDRTAIELLSKIGEPALDIMIDALKEKRTRRIAADVLGIMKAKKAIPELLKYILTDSCLISATLAQIGDKSAIEPMIKIILNPTNNDVTSVAKALTEFDDPIVIEPIIEYMSSLDCMNNYGFSECLVKFRDERTLELILQYNYNLFSRYKQTMAIQSLKELTGQNIGNDTEKWYVWIEQNKAKKLNIDISKVDPKIIQLLDDLASADYKKNKIAIDELVKMGAPVLDPLMTALKYKRAKTRCYILQILGTIKDKRAIETIINMLEDWSLEVRMFASSALVKYGDDAVPALIKALENTKASVRTQAVISLGRINNADAVAALKKILEKDPDENVKIYAEKMLSITNK